MDVMNSYVDFEKEEVLVGDRRNQYLVVVIKKEVRKDGRMNERGNRTSFALAFKRRLSDVGYVTEELVDKFKWPMEPGSKSF